MLRNVNDLSEYDIKRIRKFCENTDMKEYVRKFLSSRLSVNKAAKAKKQLPPPVKLDIPDDGSRNISIKIISARGFLGFVDPDPHSKVFLDINMAGKRFRTTTSEVGVDLYISSSFSYNSKVPIKKLVQTGYGEVCAVLVSGGYSCVYGTGSFEWRRALQETTLFPIELIDPNNDVCGLVSIQVVVTPTMDISDDLIEYIKNKPKKTSYITRISSRDIPTPYHALRFVSLLSNRSTKATMTAKVIKDQVKRKPRELHSILASRGGNTEEMCILLASFLCGFGFNAYIYGETVVTFTDQQIYSWDPIKGTVTPTAKLQPLELTGCEIKYQPLVQTPSVHLNDPRIWKKIILPKACIPVPLCPCDIVDIKEIEYEVKRKIVIARAEKKTYFDQEIEDALRPQLYAYENDMLNKTVDIWKVLVNESIKTLIPKRSAISAFPICIHSSDSSIIFYEIMEKSGNDIKSRDSELFFCTMAIFPYVENIYSTWVLYGYILDDY